MNKKLPKTPLGAKLLAIRKRAISRGLRVVPTDELSEYIAKYLERDRLAEFEIKEIGQ